MTRLVFRVDGDLSEELLSAFRNLTSGRQRASTTLTGDVADQEQLQGVLNLLSSLGIDVVEVLTIPDD